MNKTLILAIDPGTEESAYSFIRIKDRKPLKKGKINNSEMLEVFKWEEIQDCDCVACEMIASYGMPVGKEVFETCLFIGRLEENTLSRNIPFCKVYRKEVTTHLCHSARAKDSNVRQALIDRFGVVGTKKNPGWFYGFKADIWSAYAVGVTYLDMWDVCVIQGANKEIKL